MLERDTDEKLVEPSPMGPETSRHPERALLLSRITTVPTADGMMAGTLLNHELIVEETEAAVAEHRKDVA